MRAQMALPTTSWVHTLALVILFQLLINSGEAGQPPKISEHPADSVVPRNEPVTLNCKGEGNPAPMISWTKDGKALPQVSDSRQLRFSLPSGSLFFLRVRSQDSGVYACRATNAYGQVSSRDATLEIATLREDFRISPQNTWTALGETAILECEPPRGNPEPKVYWKKNGQLLDTRGSGRYNILSIGSLSISDVREDDEGVYACVAKSIVGSRQSNLGHLRVTVRPQFTILPASASAILGSDISLVCVARGDPPPEISWSKENGSLPLKRARFDEDRFLISNVSAEDGGVYRCIAENKAGSIESSATITILPPPVLIVTPNDLELQPNSTAILECSAAGEPLPTLFWSKEGSHSIIFGGTSDRNFKVTPKGTLKIDNVSERDEGFWYCAAISSAGSIMHKIYLRVTPIEDYPPPIISMGAGNQTKVIGSTVVMPCIANGNPSPVITWYKESNSFIINHRIFTDAAGNLRINDLSLEDAGMYDCVASSRSGKYVWRSFLTIVTPSEQKENNGGNLESLNNEPNSNSEFVCPAPMKPRIVKVDSTSVTIAWHPKYFHSEFELQRKPRSTERLTRTRFFREPGFRPPRSVKSLSSSEIKFIEGMKNISLESVPIIKFWDTEKLENTEFIPGGIQTIEIKTEKFENDETDEDESEYVEEKGRFETVIEKLTEREYEEEEGEISQNGNNLIIRSRPPANSSKTRLSNDNSKNGAILFTNSHHTITDFQSTSLHSKPQARLPLPLNPSNSIKNSQITFNIEYYSAQEVKSEWLLGATVAEEIATLKFLKPNAEYIFFVRSVSDDGVSQPSPLSDTVQTSTFSTRQNDGDDVSTARGQLDSPVVVLFKTAYATSSTSIRLEWQIVTASDFIEGVYIYFRPVSMATENESIDKRDHEESTTSYQMLTVLNTGASNFQISGLEKFKTYQIFLIPFYKNVDGTPSNYLNVTTAQDVPSSPPEILDTSAFNTSALVVRWNPPSTKYHHGYLMGYQLRVWSGPVLVRNLTTNSETTSVILNNLTPGQSYSVQIGALTIKGVGTFSSMKNVNFNPDDFLKTTQSSDKINQTKQFKASGSIFTRSENEDNKEFIDASVFLGGRTPSRDFRHNDNPNELLTEAWFIALIGSVIFLMLLVFVFALYMRRCQLRRDIDKLRATAEIPDGSMPPCYPDDNLWIDSQQSKQLSLKCGEKNDFNEYENGNNYDVVQDRHSPIAYATTTLINAEKHKSNFEQFADTSKYQGFLNSENSGVLWSRIVPRSNAFGSSNIGTSASACVGLPPPTNIIAGSLDTCSQDGKVETSNGASPKVLTTFQTPLPGRMQIVVDFSNTGEHPVKSSILKYHEPRLNFRSQIHLQHPHSKKFSLQSQNRYNSVNSNIFE